ncbi:MAG: hypothetical protein CVV49_22020 [Spirochaetae bacterium HGW-Spirochaetae-5]|nr:MAG: hypothetical protein CVV49_22020 [Spirochaetae bacterium HGW-Spirochaetae-5]
MNDKKYFLCLVFFLVGTMQFLNCSTLPKKPRPDVGQWKVCYACKGCGLIEVDVIEESELSESYSEKFKSYFGRKTERDKELNDLQNEPFLKRLLLGDEKEKIEKEEKADKENLNNEVPRFERRYRKKLVTCAICCGEGWLNENDPPENCN